MSKVSSANIILVSSLDLHNPTFQPLTSLQDRQMIKKKKSIEATYSCAYGTFLSGMSKGLVNVVLCLSVDRAGKLAQLPQ